MAYDGSIIIRDQNNNPIPQQWDDENQEWKAYGEKPTEVKQTGSNVELYEYAENITLAAGAETSFFWDMRKGKARISFQGIEGDMLNDDNAVRFKFRNSEGNDIESYGNSISALVDITDNYVYTREFVPKGFVLRISVVNRDTEERTLDRIEYYGVGD